jgi:hypothetical protein
MDRGMVSEANLSWLRDGEWLYLVGAPRSALKGLRGELAGKRGWKEIRPGVAVKLCRSRKGEESFVLCRSEDRRAKEAGIHDRFSQRIEDRLSSLEKRLRTAKGAADRDKVAVQVGRIPGQNPRAAGRYKVKIEEDDEQKSGLRACFQAKPAWSEWATLTEGVHALRLRCVVRPEKARKILLDHLALKLPKRLRPAGFAEL